MSLRAVVRLLVALSCIVAGLTPAQAEKRVALIVGNWSYAHIAGLPNVRNDAAAMFELLRTANFGTIDAVYNLNVDQLRRALKMFAGKAADADVAVLYYAGHGIEVGQTNYLIPVDARLATDFDVEDETVPLDRVLQALAPARRLRLVLLDACRENPFLKSMKRTAATRSVGRGLSRVEPATANTLIAFATKPNAIAADGKGPNSPFTAALVKHLLTPGLDLRLALGKVRDDVMASTDGRQEPYVTSSLGGEVVSIVSGAPDGATAAAPPTPTVKSRFAPQTFEQYLTVYPFAAPSTQIVEKIRISTRLRTLLSSEAQAKNARLNNIGSVVESFLDVHFKTSNSFLRERFKMNNIDPRHAFKHEVFEVGRQHVLGKNIHVFASTSKPADWECRACGVEVSLFEFINDGYGALSIGTVALGVGDYGQWGGLAKEKVRMVGIGPDRYGVLVEGGGAFPGAAIEISESLIVPVAGTYLAVFEETTSAASPMGAIGGPTSLKAVMRFLPTDGYFFDIALEKAMTARTGQKSRETVFFEFDGVRGTYRKASSKR